MSRIIQNRLSMEALREKASENIASQELLSKISGGMENDCHDATPQQEILKENVKECTGNA